MGQPTCEQKKLPAERAADSQRRTEQNSHTLAGKIVYKFKMPG